MAEVQRDRVEALTLIYLAEDNNTGELGFWVVGDLRMEEEDACCCVRPT